MKNENDMMITKSKSRLSVFNSGMFDADGHELVISCGYTNGGKFGYFVCKEKVTFVGNPHDNTYEYIDQSAFYLKETEKTYQIVLEEVKRMIA